MTVDVIEEAGFLPALMGLGLSHGLTSDERAGRAWFEVDLERRLQNRAKNLAPMDGGHNKFLESIQVWLDIKAPRYWWQEFDTYRVGVSKQSESTMHTLTRRKLTQEDFVSPIPSLRLAELNKVIGRYSSAKEIDLLPDMHFRELKLLLPEGFLQRRIVNLNYKVLRNIYTQRRTHRLIEWRLFLGKVLEQIESPDFITKERESK